jgi:Tfp pilus assembly protein PilF
VFHLQLSKNRVPRWFTEGLAEYEAALARPEWKREDDAMLWQALRAGRLPPLAAMNRAFNRARSPSELTTAYFFAYRAVQYIVERYGWTDVRRLLLALSEGQKLEAAVQRVLGVSLQELDGEFREALARRLSRFDHQYAPDLSAYEDVQAATALAAQNPKDPEQLAGLSLAELNAGQLEAAARAAQTALTQAPRQRLALYAQARVALAQGDALRAEQSLRALVHEGADGYTLRMLLARVALSRGNTRLALQHAQSAVQFDPERSDAHKLLLELGAKSGDEQLTLSALRALAELDQHDVLTHAAYLGLLVKHESWEAVVREGETALYIAPENASIHLHLGQGYVERGEYTLGLAELDRALALHYSQPGLVRLARARAFLRQQDREGARREVKLALLSDPSLDQRARALIAP